MQRWTSQTQGMQALSDFVHKLCPLQLSSVVWRIVRWECTLQLHDRTVKICLLHDARGLDQNVQLKSWGSVRIHLSLSNMYNSSLTVSCGALKILFANHLWLSFQLMLFQLFPSTDLWKYGRNQAHFFALPCSFQACTFLWFCKLWYLLLLPVCFCSLMICKRLDSVKDRQASLPFLHHVSCNPDELILH